ncbi:MAG: peptide-methionine (R)-S-oxide reductase MsrB [Rhodocyclaceae bacterium]|nr:peptide-methionine (R)-S-oxide reductase MsrB [Rhodocyclaceae bacterium]
MNTDDKPTLKKRLSEIQYRVTQEAATEQPFSGQFWNHWEEGAYRCICCAAELFLSQDKFDAGCGWPSFSLPRDAANVAERTDLSHGMRRIEVTCSHCGAHLGHVFNDGPAPTGLRYCINSASLDFKSDAPAGKT